jgi:hypothetical protein
MGNGYHFCEKRCVIPILHYLTSVIHQNILGMRSIYIRHKYMILHSLCLGVKQCDVKNSFSS